jgi:transcriptional regulator with XRE-family HTH domain
MKQEIRVGIGKRLKEARQSLKYSQQEVAERLEVKRQTVSSWENGRSMPTASQWYVLGRYFGLSLDYLVYGVRTIPVSQYAVMAKVFEKPGVQPPAGVFGTPARLQES